MLRALIIFFAFSFFSFSSALAVPLVDGDIAAPAAFSALEKAAEYEKFRRSERMVVISGARTSQEMAAKSMLFLEWSNGQEGRFRVVQKNKGVSVQQMAKAITERPYALSLKFIDWESNRLEACWQGRCDGVWEAIE